MSAWWKQASGIMTHDADEFQKHATDAGTDKLIIVDFFMPQCGYCVRFMPEWNHVVEDMKAELGDKIEFLKVDGTSDRHTSDRYNIMSFPSFIVLEPGTNGDKWTEWHPQNRSYHAMKKWIQSFASKYNIDKPSTALKAAEPAAENTHAALPLAAAQPTSAFMEQQMTENKKMTDMLDQLLKQQGKQVGFEKTVTENMEQMIQTQEDIQHQLAPANQPSSSNFNTLSVFLAGTILGVVMGLVFASYLIKIGRLGGKKPTKGKGASQLPAKEFSHIAKNQEYGANLRDSTQATSDHDANDETSGLL